MPVETASKSALEVEVIRKATWRLLPFLMLAYFIAFVDRVNSGFAALQMNHDIGLSQAAFGLGAGIFYISYVLCEVPSNLALEKVGARLWIARIMVTWGMVSALMALVVGPYSFYAVRFLLGAAEAGFFPGVILYLTYWFPAEYRGRIVSMFMVAIPVSSRRSRRCYCRPMAGWDCTDGSGCSFWNQSPQLSWGSRACSCCPTARRRLSALALGSAVAATSVAPFIVVLRLILVGTYALKGPFFALSSEWLAGTAAAAGLAQINALGNLAGFVDSFLIGAIQGATGSYAMALLPLVLIAAVGCVAVLLLGGGTRAGSAETVSALH